MTDQIIKEIKAAQTAPTDDYIAWAELVSRGEPVNVVLHTVRLPQSIGADAVLSRLKSQAKKTLADCGYSASEIEAAKLRLTVLPSAEETQAILDEATDSESELTLVDLAGWEAIKARFHLTPYQTEGGDLEMDLKGLKVRRSVAG